LLPVEQLPNDSIMIQENVDEILNEIIQISPSSKKINLFNNKEVIGKNRHSIWIGKKFHPEKTYGLNLYYFKKINNDFTHKIDFKKALAEAEREVFFQEFRRALCPSHLFKNNENYYNIFTKYRVGYNISKTPKKDEDPINIYVLSKAIDFISDPTILKEQSKKTKTGETPGLPTLAFFAKHLGDIDLKFSNAGLMRHTNSDGSIFTTYTQIDSGCCLAGEANLSYPIESQKIPYISSHEISINPSTELNFFNYLWLISQQQTHTANFAFYKKISEQGYAIQETVITALRCALLPHAFLKKLLIAYFNQKFDASINLAQDIAAALIKRQSFLKKSCLINANFINFFFSPEALISGVFRKELKLFFNTMTTFVKYKKTTLIDYEAHDYLEQDLLIQAQDMLKLILPKINMFYLVRILKQAKNALASEHQDEFDTAYYQILLSIDHKVEKNYHNNSFNKLKKLFENNLLILKEINSINKDFIDHLCDAMSALSQNTSIQKRALSLIIKLNYSLFSFFAQTSQLLASQKEKFFSILKTVIDWSINKLTNEEQTNLSIILNNPQALPLIDDSIKFMFNSMLTTLIEPQEPLFFSKIAYEPTRHTIKNKNRGL
jgi:hypothetical protein